MTSQQLARRETRATRRRSAGSAPGRVQPARGRRGGPLAGLLGLACYAAGSLIAGLPGPGTPARTMIAHLAAVRASVLAGTLLMFLALPLLLGFLGYFVSLLARAEGSPPLFAIWAAGAWLMLLAIIAAGLIPLVAVAWSGAAGLPPAVVRIAFDTSNLSLYALSAPVAAASVLAPSVVIWRSRVLPRWLVWLGVVEVAVNAVELAGLFASKGADTAGYAAGAGPLLWIVWAGAISVAALTAQPRPSHQIAAPGGSRADRPRPPAGLSQEETS